MSQSALATIGVILVALVWGGEFVLVHNALEILEPHCFNFIRFIVASLFLWLCLKARQDKKPLTSEVIWHGCGLGLLLFAAFASQTVGMLYTSVSNSGFITGLNVVLVPLFGLLVLGERLRIFALGGVLLAATGLYLLTAAGITGFNLGDCLTLLCAAVLALHIVLTGVVTERHDALQLTFVQLLTVSGLSLGSALVAEDWRVMLKPAVYADPNILLAIFVASILGTGFAFLIQTWAQSLLSSTRVALIFTLEPVFAALAADLFLSEQLAPAAGIGALLILSGIILAECPRPAPSIAARAIEGQKES